MLGYPTHFGQMECLKLISAQSFPEKRIGYLGLTLLLTEQTEVLTLVTNSLKLDLTNSNQYIVALSLIAIGNLATQDMARDLVSDVEKLLKDTNSYLRKKAALAMIRLITKEPDLIEHVSEKVIALLKDRSHGVLITGLQLLTEVVDIMPSQIEEYRKLVPSLVRLLRNFISMGYSPEHDVGGITDPFVQVKLIHLLRYLGKGNEEASDLMNDVLAQVATNTETAKNAGNAILYECVLTIMDVQSDSGLRVLAINILGRFLLNRDNNIRYVALNTLSKVVHEDMAAVQRHRNTIVDCLKDSDISIRQRALELIYQLVNDQNVEALTSELLNYLVVAHAEHKLSLVSKIMQVVEKYSPNNKWRVDTIVTMLSLAGNETDDNNTRSAIIYLSQAEGLQSYAVHRLYSILKEDTSQLSLVHVGIWYIGEYGNLLVLPSTVPTGGSSDAGVAVQDIVSSLDKCFRIHNSTVVTKGYLLNALMKLTVRVNSSVKAAILEIISQYRSSMVLELQQRGVEYSTLLGSPHYDGLRTELLGKMPILDDAALRKRKQEFNDSENLGTGSMAADLGKIQISAAPQLTSNQTHLNQPSSQYTATSSAAPPAAKGGNFLLDLDDIFGGGGSAPLAPTQVQQKPAAQSQQFNMNSMAAPAPAPANNSTDLLSDIFSMPNNSAPLVPQSNNFMQQSAPAFSPQAPQTVLSPQSNSLMGLSSPVPVPVVSSLAAQPAPAPPLSIKAFDKNGFIVAMDLAKPNPSNPANTVITCRFSNATSSPISGLVFQAAVPKYLKLEMLPPSSTIIAANSNGTVTQEIRLTNSLQGEKPIMLKLKIAYSSGGKNVSSLCVCYVNLFHLMFLCNLNVIQVEELSQVSNFPPQY